jgi:hypothetical protein
MGTVDKAVKAYCNSTIMLFLTQRCHISLPNNVCGFFITSFELLSFYYPFGSILTKN